MVGVWLLGSLSCVPVSCARDEDPVQLLLASLAAQRSVQLEHWGLASVASMGNPLTQTSAGLST